MLNSAKIRYAGIFAILAKISIFAMHSYFGYDSEISLS